MPSRAIAYAAFAFLMIAAGPAWSADWPMWRYDAGRTAASAEQLPEKLQLLWTRKGEPREQAWDDPLNLDLMTYDRVFEPIVMGGRMFVAYNDRDKVAAFDAETGEELWSFFTEGPVRLPPAASEGRVYFGSDDGRLYCVDAENGRLHWQFRGGPSERHALGNRRLTSAWPVRGGPVLRDGQVYFAASIWPFMGVFIYALDAETGDVVWVNDSQGAQYIKQPHSAPSFAGVAPQGALVATEKLLVVPGGRSVPAAFDRRTGQLRHFELNSGGKGTGGSFVVANDSVYFVHTRLKGTREFELESGKKTAFQPNEPVLHGELVYSAETSGRGDDERPVVRAYGPDREVVWEVAADGRGDLILAGDRLYAAGPERLSAIRLPTGDAPAEVVWSAPSPGPVERLLAADAKLFAVTLDGDILAYGAPRNTEPRVIAESFADLRPTTAAKQTAERLLQASDAEGYAFWFDASDESLVEAMAVASPFVQLAVVDEDATRVDTLRRQLDRAGLYGKVTLHRASANSFLTPPYVAHMIFVGRGLASQAAAEPELMATLYESVRPYGGVLQLLASAEDRPQIAARVAAMKLEQARVDVTDDAVVIHREGALPGSAVWTHQHGDIANTRKSDDQRVKLPLGVLWFGGSSNMDVLPRHGHGPPEQVVGGRLFIQGINILSARDVYTGRVLWQREFEDLGTYDVYYDDTYKETPLDPAYNQVHIPGANARGTNYVVTEDRVYIVEKNVCRVLDQATGELLQSIALPQQDAENPKEWGFLGVYEDVLFGGVGFANYRSRHGLSFDDVDSKLRRSKAGFGSKSLDRAGSAALVGFDRRTGEQLWKLDARHSFWHNGIVAGNGRVYCLDKNPQPVEERLLRRGLSLPETYRIAAIDARTGELLWEVQDGIFGTWLGYSEEHDLLLQAGAAASDRLPVEVGQGMSVHRGSDGSVVWKKESLKYSGPCILHNDLILTNANSYRESAGAFHLLTGEQKMVINPLTGEPQPWQITRAYGCNTLIASENLLTFRSGAAGFYDLLSDSGTGNLGGFKSGCTANLVVANGVLNAPDYTRTCSCAYQNQTSLALVHMPDLETEMWTVSQWTNVEPGRRFQSLGVNFGAPGHRRDRNGLLWLEYPVATVEESPLSVTIEGDANYVQRHSSASDDADYPWVLSSGVEGASAIRIGLRAAGENKEGAAEPEVETPCQVRLYFGAPRGSASGERVFDVWLQGRLVIEGLTLPEGESVIREFQGVPAGDELVIKLVPGRGRPILSGVEVRRAN